MLRIIGDVHGKYKEYLRLLPEKYMSIQVGDLAFSYGFYKQIYHTNPSNHFFFPGNHDDYSKCFESPHCLGSWGNIEFIDPHSGNLDKFFFVRGADSIDRAYRTIGVSWWENEELTEQELEQALEWYCERPPELVLSHDCPQSVCTSLFGIKDVSRTRHYLEQMLKAHPPKAWIFGHHHKTIDQKIKGTRFICLNELNYIDWEHGGRNCHVQSR